MKALAAVALFFVLVATVAYAATRTRPATSLDDVTGMPVVSYEAHRVGETAQFSVRACFVARQSDGGIVQLPEPCAQCVTSGMPTNADLHPCRKAVLDASGFSP